MVQKTKSRVIGVNGFFLCQPDTGIGQVSVSFLKDLARTNLPNDWRFIIYLKKKVPEKLQQQLSGQNISFQVVSGNYRRDDLFRKFLWERYWLPQQAKRDGCTDFFSLYQSASVFSTRSLRHLMLVHDVVPKRFPVYLNNWRKKSYQYFVDRAIKRADKILTISKFSQEEISRVYHIPLQKITVNYIACNPIFYQPLSPDKIFKKLKKYGLSPGDDFIFYVGGFDIRKNIANLIKAYSSLAGSLADPPQLVLAGRFYPHLVPLVTDLKKEIKNNSERYHLNPKLYRLVGFIPEGDLPAFYQAATVFAYPSLYEGFGLPVLEAMASRCPVVTSNTSAIPEIISQEAGYLVENPENVNEIKKMLKKSLTDNPKNRERKISLAYRESQKFSWPWFTKTFLQLLREESQDKVNK